MSFFESQPSFHGPVIQSHGTLTQTDIARNLNFRGQWQPGTVYLENDFVTDELSVDLGDPVDGTVAFVAVSRSFNIRPDAATVPTQFWRFPTTFEVGRAFTYVLFIDVPIPFIALNINLDLVGQFILPVMSVLGIPEAIRWLLTNAKRLIDPIVEDAQALIRAIPEAAILICVRVGGVDIVNITLVAQRVPIVVGAPVFVLDLPNFAVDLSLELPVKIPSTNMVIRVPVPFPDVIVPTPVITGGHVFASAYAEAVPEPTPIKQPVSFPTV